MIRAARKTSTERMPLDSGGGNKLRRWRQSGGAKSDIVAPPLPGTLAARTGRKALTTPVCALVDSGKEWSLSCCLESSRALFAKQFGLFPKVCALAA